MQILKFKDVNEVIERANDTDYGLAASIFSKDLDKSIVVSNGLRAGSVWVNTYDNFDPVAPFGGFKQSGLGREKSEYALDSYTETKCVRTSNLIQSLIFFSFLGYYQNLRTKLVKLKSTRNSSGYLVRQEGLIFLSLSLFYFIFSLRYFCVVSTNH
jgi:hypothetical protein